MPYETLDLPVENKEEIPIEEIEEIGEAALEAVPVTIDSDPARLIHEEFPSVSPRPSERVGHIHHAATETAPIVPPEQEDDVPHIEAHSLSDFEQLLGYALPEEIKQQVAQLKSEKLAGVKAELDMLDELGKELETGICAKWIVNGELRIPPLAEATTPQIMQIIEQKLKDYAQSDEGQRDLRESRLSQLVENPQPSEADIDEAARFLGMSASKLGVMPGRKAKFTSSVIAGAKEYLDRNAEFDELVDYKKKTPEEERASERYKAEDEISKIIDPARSSLAEPLKQSGLWDRYERERMELSDLPAKVAELDKAATGSAEQLMESAKEAQFRYLLSAITKGHLALEEIPAILAEKEGPQITQDLHGIASGFQSAEYQKLLSLLPEPSLLGLDISESDIEQVGQGFDRLSQIGEIMGLKPSEKSKDMEIIHKSIDQTQESFFKSIGSEYDMYWHFSPFGMRIIESKQLSPSQITGNVMTGWHSRSLHFIKPGMTGMKSMVDYTGYAETGLTLGKSEKIDDAFGVAVIYPLGELAAELPYRDEPPEEDRTSADVVFRESESESNRSVPLEKAFIFPMQTGAQIDRLREKPGYADIFTKEWQSREELAEALTKRALELAGFDSQWIEEHVLQPVKYQEGHAPRADSVYSEVSEQVRAKLPESHTLIVPISAKEGGFETHDVGNGQSGWHEKLVRIERQPAVSA